MMQQLFRIAKQLLNIQLTTLYFFTKPSFKLKVYETTLDVLQQTRVISGYTLIFLSLWITAPSLVSAKSASNDLPENATAKSYGEGWNCNQGYRERKGACFAVRVPANAYPTNKTYGKGWECKRGFREAVNACEQIKVPQNGYLDYTGIKVKCDRGYLLVKKHCVLIKVPENGYLKASSYGPGWECERGYRADRGACKPFKVPENAYISYSGKEWECSKPHVKKRGKCILPVKN